MREYVTRKSKLLCPHARAKNSLYCNELSVQSGLLDGELKSATIPSDIVLILAPDSKTAMYNAFKHYFGQRQK